MASSQKREDLNKSLGSPQWHGLSLFDDAFSWHFGSYDHHIGYRSSLGDILARIAPHAWDSGAVNLERVMGVTAAARQLRRVLASEIDSPAALYLMAETGNRSSSPRQATGGSLVVIAKRDEISGNLSLVELDNVIAGYEQAFGMSSFKMVRCILGEDSRAPDLPPVPESARLKFGGELANWVAVLRLRQGLIRKIASEKWEPVNLSESDHVAARRGEYQHFQKRHPLKWSNPFQAGDPDFQGISEGIRGITNNAVVKEVRDALKAKRPSRTQSYTRKLLRGLDTLKTFAAAHRAKRRDGLDESRLYGEIQQYQERKRVAESQLFKVPIKRAAELLNVKPSTIQEYIASRVLLGEFKDGRGAIHLSFGQCLAVAQEYGVDISPDDFGDFLANAQTLEPRKDTTPPALNAEGSRLDYLREVEKPELKAALAAAELNSASLELSTKRIVDPGREVVTISELRELVADPDGEKHQAPTVKEVADLMRAHGIPTTTHGKKRHLCAVRPKTEAEQANWKKFLSELMTGKPLDETEERQASSSARTVVSQPGSEWLGAPIGSAAPDIYKRAERHAEPSAEEPDEGGIDSDDEATPDSGGEYGELNFEDPPQTAIKWTPAPGPINAEIKSALERTSTRYSRRQMVDLVRDLPPVLTTDSELDIYSKRRRALDIERRPFRVDDSEFFSCQSFCDTRRGWNQIANGSCSLLHLRSPEPPEPRPRGRPLVRLGIGVPLGMYGDMWHRKAA